MRIQRGQNFCIMTHPIAQLDAFLWASATNALTELAHRCELRDNYHVRHGAVVFETDRESLDWTGAAKVSLSAEDSLA